MSIESTKVRSYVLKTSDSEPCVGELVADRESAVAHRLPGFGRLERSVLRQAQSAAHHGGVCEARRRVREVGAESREGAEGRRRCDLCAAHSAL